MGIDVLKRSGPIEGLNKFRRLRHVGAGVELWEMRINSRPAVRVLLAPAAEDAWVLLSIVNKDDMAKDAQRWIRQSLRFYEDWLTRHPLPPASHYGESQ